MRATAPLLALVAVLACSPADEGTVTDPPGDGLVFVVGEPGSWTADEGHGVERPSFYDFGRIPFGDTVTHTFRMRNDDPAPVVIEKVTPSCSCTVPRVFYRDDAGEMIVGVPSDDAILTIPPGKVLEVTVAVDTERILKRNVDKLNTVRIVTSSDNTPFIGLETHLIVDLAFQATPNPLDLGLVPLNGGGSAVTEIVRANDTGARLTGEILEAPENAVATIERSWRANIDFWSLRLELLAPLEEVGFLHGEIVLATETVDGVPYHPFRVPWTARVIPDIEFEPTRLHVGQLEANEAGEGEVELVCNLPGHRVRVVDGWVTGDWSEYLDLEWVPLESDRHGRSPVWTVRLAVQPGIEDEVFSGTVVLRLDDDQFPTLEVPYVGLISSS